MSKCHQLSSVEGERENYKYEDTCWANRITWREIKEKILTKNSPLYQNNNGFCGHFEPEYLFDVQVLHSITYNKDLYRIGCRERQREREREGKREE